MRKTATAFLAFALVFGLIGGAGAQIVPENHYLVYQLAESFTVDFGVTIFDQFDQFFGSYSTNNLVMDKFANPVSKNEEPFFNFDIHQTWWQINDPQDIKTVGLLNQFGHQEWEVGDGRYLVLPALKDQPGGEVPPWNHYKCYDAVGQPMDVPVALFDQWGTYTSIAVNPILFCNPCIKELADGTRFEIETPEAHLAVYRLEPPIPSDNFAVAFDQFGEWPINAIEAIWLVVPSEKLTVVGNETKSWGGVKSLFR